MELPEVIEVLRAEQLDFRLTWLTGTQVRFEIDLSKEPFKHVADVVQLFRDIDAHMNDQMLVIIADENANWTRVGGVREP